MQRRKEWCLPIVLMLTAAAIGQAAAQNVPRVDFYDNLEVRRVRSSDLAYFLDEAVSPDGTLISAQDWTGDGLGVLEVFDLATGERHRVNEERRGTGFAESTTFSPDGQRIAYTWYNYDRNSGPPWGYSIRSIKVDGSDERVIFPREDEELPVENWVYLNIQAWSPDGQSILLNVGREDLPERAAEFGLVSVEDGTYRALATTAWSVPSVAAFSPDARYVAYDTNDAELDANGQATHSIYIVATDGSGEAQMVVEQGYLHGWLPDGRGLLFNSSTLEPKGLWSLPLVDGVPIGSPELVRAIDMPVQKLGFAGNAYFYGIHEGGQAIHVASIDLEQGEILGPIETYFDTARAGEQPGSWAPSWSPDGQRFAYRIGTRLIVRSLTGELQNEFETNIEQYGRYRSAWTAEGNGVLIWGSDSSGQLAVYRVDLTNGEVSAYPNESQLARRFFSMGIDGTLYYKQDGQVVAHDAGASETRVVAPLPGSTSTLTASPDGTYLALLNTGVAVDGTEDGFVYGIEVVPTTGGVPQEVYRFVSTDIIRQVTLTWTPDGESILVYQPYASPESAGLWQIPADGGEARLLIPADYFAENTENIGDDYPKSLIVSPDGRRIIFAAGGGSGEYWMLSGFPGAQ